MSWSPKQRELFDAWHDPGVDVILASGPVQTGKTVGQVGAALSWMAAEHSGEDFILGSRSQRQLMGSVVKYAGRAARAMGTEFVRTSSGWSMESTCGPPNNFIPLYGADAGSADKARSFSAVGALLDEMTLLPPDFTDSVADRLSQDGAKLGGAMNPGPPLHPVRARWWPLAQDPDSGVRWIDFALSDNPGLSDRFIAQLEDRYVGAMKQRMVYGEWAAGEAEIWAERRSSPAPPAWDVVGHILGVDWGHATSTHAVLIAITADGRYWCCDEWEWTGRARGPLDETIQAHKIAKWVAGRPLRRCWVDPSATGLGTALAQVLACDVLAADNNVGDGIQYVRWLFSRGRLHVDEDACPILWGQCDNYHNNPDKLKIGIEEPLKDGNDHGPDGLRYALWSEAGRGRSHRIYRRRPAA
ncbi:hypothetical protein F4Y93_12235 [Candidatus Poribacteria bacterium]|nr:hypothetical protein [Candidatus Poribacteria bacterium]